jgi:RNA-binding protein
MSLTGKERRALRALGHKLKPIVQVGRGGIDEGLVAAIDRALTDHELIKVKIAEAAGELLEERDDTAEALAKATQSAVAQVLGGTVLLYRKHPETPKIDLAATTRRKP